MPAGNKIVGIQNQRLTRALATLLEDWKGPVEILERLTALAFIGVRSAQAVERPALANGTGVDDVDVGRRGKFLSRGFGSSCEPARRPARSGFSGHGRVWVVDVVPNPHGIVQILERFFMLAKVLVNPSRWR